MADDKIRGQPYEAAAASGEREAREAQVALQGEVDGERQDRETEPQESGFASRA